MAEPKGDRQREERPGPIPGASSIHAEIWIGFRPYLIKIVVDFLIAVCLWVVLFLFKLLTRWLAIDGWAGEFIVNVHAAGAVCAFILFALLLAIDLYLLHTSEIRSKRQ